MSEEPKGKQEEGDSPAADASSGMAWILKGDGSMQNDDVPSHPTHCTPMRALDEREVGKIARLRDEMKDALIPEFDDDCVLLRFLRARDWKVSKAKPMMEEAIKWHKSMVPFTASEHLKWALYMKTRHIVVEHCDKYGRPILWINTSLMNPNSWLMTGETFEAFLHTGVKQIMEEMWPRIRATHYGKAVLVFNLFEFDRPKHSNIPYLKALIPVLQDYYPDTVSKILIVDAPWIVWGIYKIISPFLDAQTRAKVEWVNHETVLQFIEPQFVPVSLGGTWDEPTPEVDMFECNEEELSLKEEMNKDAPTKKCKSCGKQKVQADFSKNQWKKGDGRKCTACVAK